jgi:hypothetical protein
MEQTDELVLAHFRQHGCIPAEVQFSDGRVVELTDGVCEELADALEGRAPAALIEQLKEGRL